MPLARHSSKDLERGQAASPQPPLPGTEERGRRLGEAEATVGRENVVLVTTTGHPSMDMYALRLAERLPVARRHVRLEGTSAGLFNEPLVGLASLCSLRGDVRAIRLLRSERRLLHLPNHHLARYGRALTAPYAVTAHDVIRWLDARGLGPYISRPNLRHRVCIGLDYGGIVRAAAIIAPSRATKADIVQHLGVREERVHVVYMGVDHGLFRPVLGSPLSVPYLLFVGTEHPRKNLIGLLKAFAKLKTQRRFRDLKLVKIGSAGSAEAPFRRATVRAVLELELEDEVVFAGRIAPHELPAYYSGAQCAVLPSIYEGFGFAALEGMACGCPVIVSNVTSLPEIVGDAGLQVAPHDVEGLRRSIELVLTDRGTRDLLHQRGLERAKRFSWDRCAAETMEVYRSVLDSLPLAGPVSRVEAP